MHRRLLLLFVVTLPWLFVNQAQASDYQSNNLFFPELVYKHHFNENPKTNKESDSHPALTFLHIGKYNTFHTIFEAYFNEDEERIARFQLGFDYAGAHQVWLGSLHTPIGYWNKEYHHGSYLETSLSRPAPTMSAWPEHMAGIGLNGAFSNFDQKVHYDLVIGLAPILNKDGDLEDFDIADLGNNNRGAIAGRISYHPDPLSDTEFGLSLAYFDVNSQLSTQRDFDKKVVSAYLNWEHNQHRLISEVFYINTDLSSPTVTGDDYFYNGYVQYENMLNSSFTAFARVEESLNEEDATALKVHHDFIKLGRRLGIRYDFLGNQALTIEAASLNKTGGKEVESISIQWSAVFQ